MNNENNKEKRPKYAISFLVVLSVFTTIFMIYHIYAICNLSTSQECIKNSYMEHINVVDSLYCKLNSHNKTILSTYMQDSLYNIKIEFLYNEYNKILKEDSLRLLNERMLIESQAKTMIDLHLNKVEHEYSNLTMWAAVLTILFLVFSFYSMYKIDEMVEQGRVGLNELDIIKNKGEEKIKSFNKESLKTFNAFRISKDELFSRFQDVFKRRVNDMDNMLRSNERKLNAYVLKKQNEINHDIKIVHNKCISVEQKVEQNIENIKYEQIILSQKYDIIQQQLDVLTAMTTTKEKNNGID